MTLREIDNAMKPYVLAVALCAVGAIALVTLTGTGIFIYWSLT